MIGKTWKSTNLIFYKLNIYSESFYMGDLVLSTVPRAIITRLKDILSKIKRAKLNMACACVCVCVCVCTRAIALHSWSGLNDGILLGKVHHFTSLRGRYGIETCCGYIFFVFCIRRIVENILKITRIPLKKLSVLLGEILQKCEWCWKTLKSVNHKKPGVSHETTNQPHWIVLKVSSLSWVT